MKGLKLLLLTFATLAITACSDDTTDEWHGDFGSIQVPDTRQLSQKIPAGQTAGNSEIFFSTNDAWNSAITDESRAEAPTWVRINPDHGDAAGDYDIRVETDPNTAEESRTAFIEITCGTNSILITITQWEPMERIPMNRTNPTSENRFGIGNCTRSSGATLREV